MRYLWPPLWSDVGGGAYDEGLGDPAASEAIDTQAARHKAERFVEDSANPNVAAESLCEMVVPTPVLRRLPVKPGDAVSLLCTNGDHELATASLALGLRRVLSEERPGVEVDEVHVEEPTVSAVRAAVGEWLRCYAGQDITLAPIPAPSGIAYGMVLAAFESDPVPKLLSLRKERPKSLRLDVSSSPNAWFERMRLFAGLGADFEALDKVQRLHDDAGVDIQDDMGVTRLAARSLEGLRCLLVDLVRRGDLRAPLMARAWLEAEIEALIDSHQGARALVNKTLARRSCGQLRGHRHTLGCKLAALREPGLVGTGAGRLAAEYGWVNDHLLAKDTHALLVGDLELRDKLAEKLRALDRDDKRRNVARTNQVWDHPLLPTGHVVLVRPVGRREQQVVDGATCLPLAEGFGTQKLWQNVTDRFAELGMAPKRQEQPAEVMLALGVTKVTPVLLASEESRTELDAVREAQCEALKNAGLGVGQPVELDCLPHSVLPPDPGELPRLDPAPDLVIAVPISGTNEMGIQALMLATELAARYGAAVMYVESEGWPGRAASYQLQSHGVAAFAGQLDRLRKVAVPLVRDMELETAARVLTAGGRALAQTRDRMLKLAAAWVSGDVTASSWRVEFAGRLEPLLDPQAGLAFTAPWWAAHLAQAVREQMAPDELAKGAWLQGLKTARNWSVTSHGLNRTRPLRDVLVGAGLRSVHDVPTLLNGLIDELDPGGDRDHWFLTEWHGVLDALDGGGVRERL